jgi:hypothetical protein
VDWRGANWLQPGSDESESGAEQQVEYPKMKNSESTRLGWFQVAASSILYFAGSAHLHLIYT